MGIWNTFTTLFSKPVVTDVTIVKAIDQLPQTIIETTHPVILQEILNTNIKESQMNNVLVLIPTIIDLIKAVEVLLPQSSGKDKLDAVLAALGNIAGEVTNLAPVVTPLIAAIVKGLNALGVFTKKPVA